MLKDFRILRSKSPLFIVQAADSWNLAPFASNSSGANSQFQIACEQNELAQFDTGTSEVISRF